MSTRIAGNPMWLPEPIATENADAGINRDEIISYSMLVLLENLNPRERATFILKEAYDYSHEDIAQALSITVENSRKLLSRAKSKLASPAKPVQETTLDTKAYLENYITVIKSGDIKSLEKLLAQEVTVITDGGGKVYSPPPTMHFNPLALSFLALHMYLLFQQTMQGGNLPHKPRHVTLSKK